MIVNLTMKKPYAYLFVAYAAIFALFVGTARGAPPINDNRPKGPKDFDAIIKTAKPGQTIELDKGGAYI